MHSQVVYKMNNTNAIYQSIINSIERLTSQESITTIEEIYNGDEDNLAKLYDLEESLTNILGEINSYKEANAFFDNFSELYDLLSENAEIINHQSNISLKSLMYAIKLVRLLENSFETIPEEDIIPFSEFTKFDEIPHFIESQFYLYAGNEDYENAMVFINTEDGIDNLIQSNEEIPDSFVILILNFLANHNFEQNKKLLIIKSPETEITINKAISALKLHLVCSGDSYHKIETTQRNNLNQFKETISLSKNYNQFDDSLMILSEYNSRNELLNKYLSIYHLVENFMCRFPLVRLQNNNNGNMFSIRNFRDMYDDLDGKEITMIRNFFKVIFSENYRSSYFLNIAHDNFKNLVNNSIMTEPDIDDALIKLGMINKGIALTYDTVSNYSAGQVRSELPQKLADMVYGIRNSIVHNKETEFHLSHEYMEPCIYDLINSYVLDILELVLLDLICNENDIIWYSYSRIKLFED